MTNSVLVRARRAALPPLRVAAAFTLLVSGAVVTIATTARPALAYTVPSTDNGAGSLPTNSLDYPVTMSDGTTLVTARIIVPNQTPPNDIYHDNGTHWPLVVYMAGQGTNRCQDINGGTTGAGSWYTRHQLVADGYAVLSFNGRGGPTPNNHGATGTDTTGCTASADALDAINDDGYDLNGPKDTRDVLDLIAWAQGGCQNAGGTHQCDTVSTTKVAVMGAGVDGARTWLMPAADNALYGAGNTKIDAIIPVGSQLPVLNAKDLSKDPVTDTARPVDLGHLGTGVMLDSFAGASGHADTSVMTHQDEMLRDRYLPSSFTSNYVTSGQTYASPNTKRLTIASGGATFSPADVDSRIIVYGAVAGTPPTALETRIASYTSATEVQLQDATSAVGSGLTVLWRTPNWTVPSDTQAWWNARTVLDDVGTVDKAGDITIPTFAVHSFLDSIADPTPEILALNKVNTTNRYLYLGACGADPARCATTNASNVKAKVFAFLEQHLLGGGTGPAAKLYYAVPKAWVSTTNNPFTGTNSDIWPESSHATSTAWPPIGTDHFTESTTCLRGVSPWYFTTCPPAAAADTNLRVIDNGVRNAAAADFCGAVFTYLEVPGYGLAEQATYDFAVGAADVVVGKVALDVWLKSSQPRVQVYFDIFDTMLGMSSNSTGAMTAGSKTLTIGGTSPTKFDPDVVGMPVSIPGANGGLTLNTMITGYLNDTTVTVEKAATTTVSSKIVSWSRGVRMAQGVATAVPVHRTADANKAYRFKFTPTGAAWTFAAGHTYRFRIASQAPLLFSQEPIPSTFTIFHNDTSGSPGGQKLNQLIIWYKVE